MYLECINIECLWRKGYHFQSVICNTTKLYKQKPSTKIAEGSKKYSNYKFVLQFFSMTLFKLLATTTRTRIITTR